MFSLRTNLFVAAITAGFSGVFAQSLSSQCTSTLTGVVISPAGSCLNAQALVAIVTAGSNSSLVGPIDNWLGGLCGQPACANDTLANLVTTIVNGCQTDLQSVGFGQVTNTQQVISIVQQAYPTVRQVACLKDSGNSSTLCVTETLTNIQSSTGTLSKNALTTLISQAMQGQLPNVPSSALCTDCTKEAFNIIKDDYPSLVNSNVDNAVSTECGAAFVDGTTPTSISESANTATASPAGASGSGAAAISGGFIGVGLTSVLTLLSAFATLA